MWYIRGDEKQSGNWRFLSGGVLVLQVSVPASQARHNADLHLISYAFGAADEVWEISMESFQAVLSAEL